MSVYTPEYPRQRQTSPNSGESVLVIYNANSGSSGPAAGAGLAPLFSPDNKVHAPVWFDEAREYLHTETGAEPSMLATESEEDAARVARDAASRGVPLIIAIGGDGTLRTIAGAIAGSQTALGIVPRGTVNVFARELSIPLDDTIAALRLALHGTTRQVDIGRVLLPGQEQPAIFLAMASLGIDAAAVETVRQEVKSAVGASAYVLSGLSALSNFVPPHAAVTMYGSDPLTEPPITHFSEPFAVLMMNSGLYGGDFRVTAEAILDDGLINVFAFDATPGSPVAFQRATFVKQFGLAAIGQYQSDANIHHFLASRIDVQCDPPTALQLDGDSVGTHSQFSVQVMHRALAVRC